MSQSMIPAFFPSASRISANAQARLTAKVDLPTPPLPLDMAMMCFTPGIPSWGPEPLVWLAFFPPVKTTETSRSVISEIGFRAASTPSRIAGGMLASEEAMAIETLALPSWKSTERTIPNETMSRLNPGYLTVERAWLIFSILTLLVFFEFCAFRRFPLLLLKKVGS